MKFPKNNGLLTQKTQQDSLHPQIKATQLINLFPSKENFTRQFFTQKYNKSTPYTSYQFSLTHPLSHSISSRFIVVDDTPLHFLGNLTHHYTLQSFDIVKL